MVRLRCVLESSNGVRAKQTPDNIQTSSSPTTPTYWVGGINFLTFGWYGDTYTYMGKAEGKVYWKVVMDQQQEV